MLPSFNMLTVTRSTRECTIRHNRLPVEATSAIAYVDDVSHLDKCYPPLTSGANGGANGGANDGANDGAN